MSKAYKAQPWPPPPPESTSVMLRCAVKNPRCDNYITVGVDLSPHPQSRFPSDTRIWAMVDALRKIKKEGWAVVKDETKNGEPWVPLAFCPDHHAKLTADHRGPRWKVLGGSDMSDGDFAEAILALRGDQDARDSISYRYGVEYK